MSFTRSSLGHITRTVHLGTALRAAGHDVTVACSAQFGHLPREAGLDHRPVHEIDPAPDWARPRTPEEFRTFVRGRLASPEYVGRCLEEETAAIRELAPDLVVSDMRNTAAVAASMAGLPSVSVHNLQLFVHPLNTILPEVVATLADLGVERPHRDHCLGDVLAVPAAETAAPLTMIPPEIRDRTELMPDEVRHIGPVLGPVPQRDAARKQWVAEYGFDANLPIIAVTMGGSAMATRPLRDVAAVLAARPVNALIITGPAIDPDEVARDLPPARGAVRVIQFTDRMLSLFAASDGAIVHGGHGTMTETVACGVPSVVVPLIPEQAEVAESMRGEAELVRVESTRVTAELDAALDRVLSEETRHRARRAAARAAATSGTANFTTLANELLTTGGR